MTYANVLLIVIATVASIKFVYNMIRDEIAERRLWKALDRHTIRLTPEDYRRIAHQTARERALQEEWRPVAAAWTCYAWTDRGERPPH